MNYDIFWCIMPPDMLMTMARLLSSARGGMLSARGGMRRAVLLSVVAIAAFAAGGDDKAAQSTHQNPTSTQAISAPTSAQATFAPTSTQAISADISAQAASVNTTQSRRFRFHAADIFDIRGLVANAANGEGGAFDNFYKDAQIRLFALLEGEFAKRATDLLSSKVPSIRRADLFLQTPLGGRKGQFGAQFIGAFAERKDRAFGWQLRLYDGEREAWGANTGMFYRQVWDGLLINNKLIYDDKFLYGGNIFLDYEDSKYGGFFRYGIGGELQNRIFSAAANYYIPLTDEKPVSGSAPPNGKATIVAFSRQGFDANIRAALPHLTNWRYLNILNAEASYYRYRGKGDTETDSGFRYGAGFSPLGNFRMKLFYDSGGDELGGEVFYSHTLGERQSNNTAADNNNDFAPDLFAPVWREHSQRIALATTGINIPVFTIIAEYAQVSITTALANLTIPPGYFVSTYAISLISSSPSVWLSNITVSPITLFYNPENSGINNTISIIISGTVGASAVVTSFAITASSFAEFNADIALQSRVFVTGVADNLVGRITPSGGVTPYTFNSSHPAEVAVSPDGEVRFNSLGNAKTVTAQITVDDNLRQTPPIIITLTLESVSAVAFFPNVIVGVESTVAIVLLEGGMIVGGGDLPTPRFQITNNTVILFSTAMEEQLNQSITISGADGLLLTFNMMINAQNPPPIVAALQSGSYGAAVLITASQLNRRTMAIITEPTGGYLMMGGAYSYDLMTDANSEIGFMLQERELRFTVGNAATATATVIIDDDSRFSAPLSLFFTLTAIESINAAIAGERIFQFDRGGMLTITPTGGNAPYIYQIINQSSPDAVALQPNGEVMINTQSSAPTTITALIRIDDTNTPTTPPYTLSLILRAVDGIEVFAAPVTTGIESTVAVVALPNAAVQDPDSLAQGFIVTNMDRVILFSTAMAREVIQQITITAAGGLQFMYTLTVNAVPVPPLMAEWINLTDISRDRFELPIIVNDPSNRGPVIGNISVRGGSRARGQLYLHTGLPFTDYFFSSIPNDDHVIFGMQFVNLPTEPTTVTVTAVFDDYNDLTPTATISLTVTAIYLLSATYTGGNFIPAGDAGDAGMITPLGSRAPFAYRLISQQPANAITINETSGNVRYSAQSEDSAITAIVEVQDNEEFTPHYTLTISITAVAALSRSAEDALVGVNTPVATVVLSDANVVNPSALPSGFMISMGSIVVFSAAMAGQTIQSITITRNSQESVFQLTIQANNPPPIMAGINITGHFSTVYLASGSDNLDLRFVASMTAGGGYLMPGGDYTYGIDSGGAGVILFPNSGSSRGFLTYDAASAKTNTVIIRIEDDNEHTDNALLTFSLTVVNPLDAEARGDSVLPLDQSGSVTIIAEGGIAPYTYDITFQSPGNAFAFGQGNNISIINLSAQPEVISLTASIVINDQTNATPPHTLAIALTAQNGFVQAGATPITFTVGVEGTLGMLIGGNNVISPPAGIRVAGNYVLFSAAMAGERMVSITVGAEGSQAEFVVPVTVSMVSPIVGAIAAGGTYSTLFFDETGNRQSVLMAELTASGGYVTVGGGYTYSILFPTETSPFFDLENVSEFLYKHQPNARTITATVRIDDNNEHSSHTFLLFTITALASVTAEFNFENRVVLAGRRDNVGMVMPSGGMGDYTFRGRQISDNNYIFNTANGNLAITARVVVANPPVRRQIAITIEVNDSFDMTPPFTLAVTVNAYAPLSVNFRNFQSTHPNNAQSGIYTVGIWEVHGGAPNQAAQNSYTRLIDGQTRRVVTAPGGAANHKWDLETVEEGGNHYLRFTRPSHFNTDNPREFTLTTNDNGTDSNITPPLIFTITLQRTQN